MANYYNKVYECANYALLNGGQLKSYTGWTGKTFYELHKDGKITNLKNGKQYLAMVNNDVRARAMADYEKAKTPEEICSLSQLISSENGWTEDVDFEEIYKTPDNRKFRVIRSKDVGSGAITQWEFV
jgi:uncharacterized protein YwgA